MLHRVAEARLPTRHGDFSCLVFESGRTHHLVLVRGTVAGAADVLVRVHSECLTGDVFGSIRCDCGAQLDEALRRIAGQGRGVVVYLRGQEGRGIGIAHKLAAYRLQEQGRDTVDANLELGLPVDDREYGMAAWILADLGVRSIRLLTNNPAKCAGLAGAGVRISDRVPLTVAPNPENLRYLRAKRRRLGHLIRGLDGAEAVTPA